MWNFVHFLGDIHLLIGVVMVFVISNFAFTTATFLKFANVNWNGIYHLLEKLQFQINFDILSHCVHLQILLEHPNLMEIHDKNI